MIGVAATCNFMSTIAANKVFFSTLEKSHPSQINKIIKTTAIIANPISIMINAKIFCHQFRFFAVALSNAASAAFQPRKSKMISNIFIFSGASGGNRTPITGSEDQCSIR